MHEKVMEEERGGEKEWVKVREEGKGEPPDI